MIYKEMGVMAVIKGGISIVYLCQNHKGFPLLDLVRVDSKCGTRNSIQFNYYPASVRGQTNSHLTRLDQYGPSC